MFRLQRERERPSAGLPDRATIGDRSFKPLATLDDEQTLELAVDTYWNLLMSLLPAEDRSRDAPSFLSLN